jgi:hypothetical protein
MPEPTATTEAPAPQAATENVTFEGWLEKQDETVKGLLTSHTTGLKSALDSERKARGDAEKQIRELAKKAEKGSESEASLTKMADQLKALETQTGFFDKAHAAGVRNLRLAYLAASQAGLVSDRGECDFSKLRTEYPELFVSAPPANAGSGTQAPPTKTSMNDQIRRAAGR